MTPPLLCFYFKFVVFELDCQFASLWMAVPPTDLVSFSPIVAQPRVQDPIWSLGPVSGPPRVLGWSTWALCVQPGSKEAN